MKERFTGLYFRFIFSFFVFILFTACRDEYNKQSCPGYEHFFTSPYQDPICHPSGELIGFNHTPIKEINYINGYNCPLQANYEYENDSAGFWLVNIDGSNPRRILPYYLEYPSWSPDGKWIAFSKNAQIMYDGL